MALLYKLVKIIRNTRLWYVRPVRASLYRILDRIFEVGPSHHLALELDLELEVNLPRITEFMYRARQEQPPGSRQHSQLCRIVATLILSCGSPPALAMVEKVSSPCDSFVRQSLGGMALI